jgi:anti-sigma factor RsiW
VHVDSDLSAYLDRELAPAERARVDAHLGTCHRCSARLAELRATASLVSALEGPLPSRSLVPHVVERWNWLRPVRSLSTVASGAFLFLFLITAVAQSGSDLGGGPASPFTRFAPTAAQPAGATAAPAGEAPATAATATPGPGAFAVGGPTAQPQPAPPAAGDLGTTQRSVASPVATPPALPAEKAAATRDTGGRTDLASPVAQTSGEAELATRDAERRPFGQSAPPSPLVWLVLAVAMAIAAGVAHWRLRAA